MSTKNKLETSTLTSCRESVLIMRKEKIKKLKQKYNPNKQTQPTLFDPDAKLYVEALHKHFFCCNKRQSCKQFCFYLQNILHL